MELFGPERKLPAVWWYNSRHGGQARFSGPLGLLAGQGELPVSFAAAAASLKKEIIVFGVEGYTDKRVENYAPKAHYLELGALDRLPELLKEAKVKNVVFAGSLPKREIYNPSVKLDGAAREVIGRPRNKGDDHLLKAFDLFLRVKCGARAVDPRHFLKNLLVPRGVITRRVPSEAEWRDLEFGWRLAKRIGRLDIGQTVVVKEGVVLAVEALEGTDGAIRRGGELGRGQAVIVKVAKPNQDLRFDLPCVGFQTLESMRDADCRVLGMDAGKTIMLYKDQLIERANAEGVALVGLS